MLSRLSIRDIVLIDRLDIDFAAGPVGADRRDRRRQVDPARCLRAGARRARRRGAGAPGRRAGPGHGGVRACAPSHPARALLAEQRHRGRGRADPAPRAVRRRAHPRLRQRPAGERAGAARRSARRWSRSTASTTTARWSMPRPTAACSTPSAGSRTTPRRSRRCGTRAARREEAVAAHRAEVERAAARGRLAAPRGRGTRQAQARRPARRPRSPSGAPP